MGTLETSSGLRAVGIDTTADAPRYVDLNLLDPDLPACVRAVLETENGIGRAAKAFETGAAEGLFTTGRLLAPVPNPSKVICIGLNYRDHAAESGAAIPSEPVCFNKFPQAVIGPEAAIELPRVSDRVDYEAELVVVIGRRGKHVTAADALGYVAGYANGNDVSARDWQIDRPGGQWLLGKTPDTFAPIGPWLVTADEIADPGRLGVRLRLNGETMQESSTRELIFPIPELIAHLSRFFTLEPGDVIFTGTPPGVGMARKPPVWLKPGDRVEVEIDGLGVLANDVVDEPAG